MSKLSPLPHTFHWCGAKNLTISHWVAFCLTKERYKVDSACYPMLRTLSFVPKKGKEKMICTFLFVLKMPKEKKMTCTVHSTKKERIWRWLPKWYAHAGLDVVFDWERRDAFSRQPLGDALFSWTERYHCLTTLINTVVRISNASVHKTVGLCTVLFALFCFSLLALWAACDWSTPCDLMEIYIVRFGNKVY